LADRFAELVQRLETVDDLERAAQILSWDQQTYMPPAGNSARGEQMTTLVETAHARFTAPEVGELLAELEAESADRPDDDERRALLRVTRHDYDQAVRLSPGLVAELQRADAAAYAAWTAARAGRSFGCFLPAFERVVRLMREKADALGFPQERYDALVDLAEPGMTAGRAETLLEELKAVLVPLVAAIGERRGQVDRSLLLQHFPEAEQWQLGREAVRAIGFDFRHGRLDATIHPFETAFSPADVRITTRIDEGFFNQGFFAMVHESGHGMYEQGIPEQWSRTPLGKGISNAVHESQSRLWENLVARSQGFWNFFLPRARHYFPQQFGDASVEEMYRAVNFVEPSLVRVEADEVTYNLHIALRFELERALMRGELQPADVPDAWAEKMQSYLGITPPDDLSGALQDIHWASGLLGSFISYTVGNVISVQFWRAAEVAVGDLEGQIARGEFSPLLQFLRQGLHRYGRALSTEEILRKTTGTGLTAEPYLGYIQAKYREIYGL